MKRASLALKRVYDPPAKKDGFRILVDRLWPRGLKKEEARLDAWMKEVAPSPGLRKWFGHDPGRFKAFGKAYRVELEHSQAAEELLASLEKHSVVTLLYAAKDEEHNHGLVLKDFLEQRSGK